MLPSRGMGAISPKKVPRAERRGDTKPVIGTDKPIQTYRKGGAAKPFWDKEKPKGRKTKHLSDKQIGTAKARTKAAGRPYPNLVDNAAVARMKKRK